MFNSYSDAAPSLAADRREVEWESLLNQKIGEVLNRLRTPEGALKHLCDYEEMDACVKMINCLLKGDTLNASLACDNMVEQQARREAEKEWEAA